MNPQYKKTTDSVLLSQFMRTNGKCNNSHYLALVLAVFCFLSEPNIPEGPEYENFKNINTILMFRGVVSPTPHDTNDSCCDLSIIWKNGSFRNRVNPQYKKTADSVLLSRFMSTNGKCNNSHYLALVLAVFCFLSEPNIPEGPEHEKISINLFPC